MKIRCANCDRKMDADEGLCPHCGAYNPSVDDRANHTRDYNAHRDHYTSPTSAYPPYPAAGGGYRTVPPPPPPPPRKGGGAVVAVVGALVTLAVVTAGLLVWLAGTMNEFGQARIADPRESNRYAGDSEESSTRPAGGLYKYLDENPTDFAATAELVAALCEEGQATEAEQVLLRLYRYGCPEAAPYRRAGEAMDSAGNSGYAVRAFLTAYSLSGQGDDLALAERCGSPADIIAVGPTTQALESFFGKPMELVSWAEVGQVRYMSLNGGDAVQYSLEDPFAESDAAFSTTVQSFAIDGGAVNAGYLYGLRELHCDQPVDMDDMQLCALTSLRSLRVTSAYGITDLQVFSTIPSLESLYVGCSTLQSLEGLEWLPNLRALGLEGTAVDDLSVLAEYPLEELTFARNEALGGLGSLAQMEQLRRLSVTRQETLDLQFLESLQRLEALAICDAGIKDFYFISELTGLRELELTGNADLKSVQGIGALRQLEALSLDGELEGVEEIAQLAALRSLHLRSPRSLEMVRGLSALEELHIDGGGRLESLEPLRGLAGLQSFAVISLSSSGSRDGYDFSLEPLASLPNLTSVRLPDAQFYGGVSALLRIPTLEYLDLTNSSADVGSGFAGLTGVRTLRMNGFELLSNVEVWSDGFFTTVNYDTPEMDTVTGSLAGLANLERLELADTDLSDIAFLAELPALEQADLSGNYITDLTALPQCPSLRQINLSGNPVRDWAPAEEAVNAQVQR